MRLLIRAALGAALSQIPSIALAGGDDGRQLLTFFFLTVISVLISIIFASIISKPIGTLSIQTPLLAPSGLAASLFL
jgi:fucose permease